MISFEKLPGGSIRKQGTGGGKNTSLFILSQVGRIRLGKGFG
jgi:hypothetical protein